MQGGAVAANRQKLKLLYLMRMLMEETDSERGLTMAQILEGLVKTEKFPCSRKLRRIWKFFRFH